jgi:hypothetical protein
MSDCPIYQTGVSGFGSFQSQTKEGAKLEDLKIQDVLKLTRRYCVTRVTSGETGNLVVKVNMKKMWRNDR